MGASTGLDGGRSSSTGVESDDTTGSSSTLEAAESTSEDSTTEVTNESLTGFVLPSGPGSSGDSSGGPLTSGSSGNGCPPPGEGVAELSESGPYVAYPDDSSSSVLSPAYQVKRHQFVIRASELATSGLPCGANVDQVSLLVSRVPQGLDGVRVAARWADDIILSDFTPAPVLFGPQTFDTVGWSSGDWFALHLDSPLDPWDAATDLLLEVALEQQGGSSSFEGGLWMLRTGEDHRHVGGYSNSSLSYPFPGLTTIIEDDEIPAFQLGYF